MIKNLEKTNGRPKANRCIGCKSTKPKMKGNKTVWICSLPRRQFKKSYQRYASSSSLAPSFYEDTLGKPKYIMAPMVAHSGLAFRSLVSKYDTDVCFTEMFHAKHFSNGEKVRLEKIDWNTNTESKPLIAQFCGNDANILVNAAKNIENSVATIDLNLGCPQGIAK